MCGALLDREGAAENAVSRRDAQRRIFIDLTDLHITGYLGQPSLRAAVTANVYERFTPFADDGWEWIVGPGDPTFDGWVYQQVDDNLVVVGVHLQCSRARLANPSLVDPTHHVSQHRMLQLTGTPWTATVGSKLWKELER
jgi:hypothetical protein